MSRRTLITGICGQDGRLLAELLLGEGREVYGIARSPAAIGRVLPLVRPVDVDLRDAVAVARCVAEVGPDEIFHLAAEHHSTQQSDRYADMRTYAGMISVNLQATVALAQGVIDAGLRSHLVFAASSQMYTAPERDLIVDENTARRPATFYGTTKAWGLAYLAGLRDARQLLASTAILFNHESPYRSPNYVTRKITRAAARARQGGKDRLRLLNIGARVDWSSARDVVVALRLMAARDVGGDYVVASGALHSVRDVLDIAFGHIGLDWREHVEFERDEIASALKGDATRLERMGWRRRSTFEETISEMVEADLGAAGYLVRGNVIGLAQLPSKSE